MLIEFCAYLLLVVQSIDPVFQSTQLC